LVQNKKALEFVSENGQELARHMFLTIHNDMESTTDYFWNIFRNTHLFKDKDHALLTVLLTFISIRVEIETQAVYRKYGDDVYTKLGEHVSSYYKSFLINFSDNEEDLSLFLMHHAHETVLNHDGEDNNVLLAVQFKKVAATEEEFSPSIFQPFAPMLLEDGSIVDIIESNI
jgi:hypothetical protein